MPIYTETGTLSGSTITVGKARPTSVISITVAGGYVAVPGTISGQTVSFTLYETGSAVSSPLAPVTTIPSESYTIAYNGF